MGCFAVVLCFYWGPRSCPEYPGAVLSSSGVVAPGTSRLRAVHAQRPTHKCVCSFVLNTEVQITKFHAHSTVGACDSAEFAASSALFLPQLPRCRAPEGFNTCACRPQQLAAGLKHLPNFFKIDVSN